MGQIKVKRIENNVFTSNTFVIYAGNDHCAWLVDCGDFEKVEDWLQSHQKVLCGIFITHCHFDHIYGINKVLEYNPDIKIYASPQAFEGMRDSKINGSLYTEHAFVVNQANDILLNDRERIVLDGLGELEAFETPGHSPDSCCFKIGGFLFTGDALIPNVRVVTKIKRGDKGLAQRSVDFILHYFDPDVFVLPGHQAGLSLSAIKKSGFNYV